MITSPTNNQLTNDTTPTISGTAEANSTVAIFDGATQIGTTTTDSAGQTTNARVFPVGPAWQVITFDAKQLVADSSVQLGLDLGRSDATVWFDNVVVRVAPG